MLLGLHVQMMIGPTIAIPATPDLTEALQSIQVTHNDEGKSGFQLTFRVGRAGLTDVLDYGLLANPLLRPFNRVVLTAVFNVVPRVLMDGIITNRQLSPGDAPGTATLTVTGEDVSVMMDMRKVRAEHPAQPEPVIALKLIGSYAQYGLLPMVMPPPSLDVPLPLERIPVQQGTDLEYLNEMGRRFGYVFFVIPGPAPMSNVAYWGPPPRIGIVQRALSINMGPETNVSSMSFQYNALAPMIVDDLVQDASFNSAMPVVTFASTRPPLVPMPALPFQMPNVRTTLLDAERSGGGPTYAQAYARAQALTDKSVDNVVTAQGELDALRYGDLLTPRALVGVRGAGFTHDGIYYVKSVSHTISRGQYKQRFTLTREGDGSITPSVIP
jgi:hypothetical protein